MFKKLLLLLSLSIFPFQEAHVSGSIARTELNNFLQIRGGVGLKIGKRGQDATDVNNARIKKLEDDLALFIKILYKDFKALKLNYGKIKKDADKRDFILLEKLDPNAKDVTVTLFDKAFVVSVNFKEIPPTEVLNKMRLMAIEVVTSPHNSNYNTIDYEKYAKAAREALHGDVTNLIKAINNDELHDDHISNMNNRYSYVTEFYMPEDLKDKVRHAFFIHKIKKALKQDDKVKKVKIISQTFYNTMNYSIYQDKKIFENLKQLLNAGMKPADFYDEENNSLFRHFFWQFAANKNYDELLAMIIKDKELFLDDYAIKNLNEYFKELKSEYSYFKENKSKFKLK